MGWQPPGLLGRSLARSRFNKSVRVEYERYIQKKSGNKLNSVTALDTPKDAMWSTIDVRLQVTAFICHVSHVCYMVSYRRLASDDHDAELICC
jgi:hypothetical protein